jgi:transposase
MIFVGIDWAEEHHDACVMDDQGVVLARLRVPDNLEGLHQLYGVFAEHASDPKDVVIGIETAAGLLTRMLHAAEYQIYVINPLAASRYRGRHTISKAKSDPGDAKMLADLVRTDRHNHRLLAEDSEEAEAIKVLARMHKNLTWARQQQVNHLRNALRDFYPAAIQAFADDLASADALGILALAPTPELGGKLTVARIQRQLEKAGRQRRLESKAAAIERCLRTQHAEAPPLVSEAYGVTVSAAVVVIGSLNQQIAELARQIQQSFEKHPDAAIILSLPGLGPILGARVVSEFGDAPNRFNDAKARKNYAGTSPVTKASGTKHVVVARYARKKRLADVCDRWAFCSLTASTGARQLYDRERARGQTHGQALRRVANRWVGILHGCLDHRQTYSEEIAWGSSKLEKAA